MDEPQVIVEEVTDPEEIARIHAQHAQAQRNADWLESHWNELLPQAFGKFIAIAGQVPYIADSPRDAWAWAEANHPEDRGALVEYVFPPGGPRFYANRR
jgi:hypothetical protein